MANTTNYAETWSRKLLDIVIQEALTSPFIVRPESDDVNWLDGKTFHFTQMSTSGYRNHRVGQAVQSGKYTQADKPFTISHDRSVGFPLDKIENLESAALAKTENINMVFQKTQAAPEVDAYFYEKVYKAASTAGLTQDTSASTITKDNVISILIGAIAKVKRYRPTLIGYVSSAVMTALEQALGERARIDIQMSTVSDYENSIETRVAKLNGVPLIEIIDDDRFCTEFTYKDDEAGGFEKAPGGKPINFLFASTQTVKTIKKIQSIYVFEPGTHLQCDGWYTYTRDCWDTFVFPNGKDGVVDSVFVDYDNAA